MSARHASVVFLDGDDGRELVDMLKRTDGVVVYGATKDTIATTAAYLAQWDDADALEWSVAEPWGTGDDTATVGRYVLAWNVGLGYVSLTRLAHLPAVAAACARRAPVGVTLTVARPSTPAASRRRSRAPSSPSPTSGSGRASTAISPGTRRRSPV